ncbi:MAG: zinc-ribbon domain-containing protein [Clostridia bacterium]|nr:zinc-ribbon domain-containing protein [Clostridia bacterium]
MKYCQKCGKELLDEAVICPNCGCAVAPVQPSSPTESPFATETPQPQSRESDSSANMALLFAFLIPIVGIILGVINMGKYQTKKYKDRCVAAIVIGAIVQIIMILLVMNIY